MVQESPTSSHPPRSGAGDRDDRQPSIGSWMHDVLGRSPDGRSTDHLAATAAKPPTDGTHPGDDLQARLAAIAENIKTLESRVTGHSADPDSVAKPASPNARAPEPQPPAAAPSSASPASAPLGSANAASDPLEALRRRKQELDRGLPAEPAQTDRGEPVPTSSEASETVATVDHSAPAATPAQGIDPSGLDRLAARLDEQFARLAGAIDDVRQIAEAAPERAVGELNKQVAELKADFTASSEARAASSDGLRMHEHAAVASLSDQVRAVQDALSAMPKPEAIRSLEEGYRHVLTRLDELKTSGQRHERIDALYSEITGLREQLDTLSEGNTAKLVGEMRAMLSEFERAPDAGESRLAEAIEQMRALAGGDPAAINDAMGAVVERLVALEARIEALASGGSSDEVTRRLDALQEEMARLATFKEEAAGLTSALSSLRDEVRAGAGSPGIDLSGLDERFSALERIETMTGAYAQQVSQITDRLNALDGSLGAQDTLAGDLAHELASLSSRVDGLAQTMPVHEIEHALLDLTTRVTSLQEDRSAERLGLAVRDLGERVESCLKSIPRTQTIIDAVEAKLDGRIEGAISPIVERLGDMDERLEGIQRAISAADGPLIEQMAKRVEQLMQSMPTPRADEALAALERQLADLNARQQKAGLVSREEVERLHAELARARASVELGSNRDLQRAIVDQVRHLADRFDTARSSGNAAVLPEIEAQLNALAQRVQSLGLFDASAAGPADDLVERLEKRVAAATSPASPAMVALQAELAALRTYSSEQDQRMHSTLESVQSALETVIRRINAIEADTEAADLLAEDIGEERASTDAEKLKRLEAEIAPPPAQARVEPSAPRQMPLPDPIAFADADIPLSSGLGSEPIDLDDLERGGPAADWSGPGLMQPQPGDAQTLLRQLSGALDGANPASGASRQPEQVADDQAAGAKPSVQQRLGAAARSGRRDATRRSAAMSGAALKGSSDAASQRASFIAAARRAAQSAALQAGGGKPAAAPAAFAGPAADMAPASQTEPARIEPELPTEMAADAQSEPQSSAEQKPKAQPDPADDLGSPVDEKAEAPVDGNTVEGLGGAAKTAREEQAKKKKKEEERQKLISRAMLVALVLFTVALGLFIASIILPRDNGVALDRQPPALSAPVEAPAADSDDSSAAADDGQDTTTSAANNDPAASRGPGEPDAPAISSAASEAVANGGAAGDVTTDDMASGFSRERGPVMAETPGGVESADQTELDAAQAGAALQQVASTPADSLDQTAPTDELAARVSRGQAPPANDLGPLLNPPMPSLPPSPMQALPEAIGPPSLRVAAAGGDAVAAFEVATRFMEGRSVERNLEAAAHWYARAAEGGLVPAAYRLGSFYEQGQGVERNIDGAIAWYERAALDGNPRAMHNLAVMAAQGQGSEGPDFSRAAAWFIPAANRGLPDSQFNLAVLYARGMGVERDMLESYKWFALAANAGDAEAGARRDEVAGALGEEALALARARVDSWAPIPVDRSATNVATPPGGWDGDAEQAAQSGPSRDQVAEAQSLLARRGFDPGPADGLIGPRTSDAVRAFRQSVGLGDTATIDSALLDALREGRAL